MKGKLSSTVWVLVLANAAALIAVLVLAYEAGRQSKGLSLAEFFTGGLSGNAGLEVLGALLVFATATLFLLIRLGNAVVKPAQELAEFSGKLSAGDTQGRLALDTTNDLAVVADNLNRTAERLGEAALRLESLEALERNVVALAAPASRMAGGDLLARGEASDPRLADVVEPIHTLLASVARVVQHARRVASDVQNSARELRAHAEASCSGATRQDQESAGAQPALEEAEAALKRLAIRATAGAESAQLADEAITHGTASAKETLDGMERLCEAVLAARGHTRSLRERTAAAVDTIHSMQQLAEQTELLALNAAVAAARADASGSGSASGGGSASGSGAHSGFGAVATPAQRGFDVVAEDVRNLARQSRAATAKEMDALLRVVLDESEKALQLMDESTREAEAGARMAEQSAKAMGSVAGVVRGSGDLLAETAGVAGAQAKAAEAALQALQVITSVAREAEQSGRIAVRTSEQINRACEQLKEAMAQFRADTAGAGPTLAADSSMAAAAGRSRS